MTPSEIEAVRKAWEADPASCPEGGTWMVTKKGLFASMTPQYSSHIAPIHHAENIVRDALHRRLLDRGAWVERASSGDIFGVLRWDGDKRSLIVSLPSLIEAMALGVVALATERTRP